MHCAKAGAIHAQMCAPHRPAEAGARPPTHTPPCSSSSSPQAPSLIRWLGTRACRRFIFRTPRLQRCGACSGDIAPRRPAPQPPALLPPLVLLLLSLRLLLLAGRQGARPPLLAPPTRTCARACIHASPPPVPCSFARSCPMHGPRQAPLVPPPPPCVSWWLQTSPSILERCVHRVTQSSRNPRMRACMHACPRTRATPPPGSPPLACPRVPASPHRPLPSLIPPPSARPHLPPPEWRHPSVVCGPRLIPPPHRAGPLQLWHRVSTLTTLFTC